MSSDNPEPRDRATSEPGEYATQLLTPPDIFDNCGIQFPVWNVLRSTLVVAVALATLAGCGTGLSAQRRYVGTLAGCDGNGTATLTRIRNEFAFAPNDGALLIRGTVAADGSLRGTLNTQPPGKPPYMLIVTGQATKDVVTVTYATPQCTAHGSLKLRPVTLMP